MGFQWSSFSQLNGKLNMSRKEHFVPGRFSVCSFLLKPMLWMGVWKKDMLRERSQHEVTCEFWWPSVTSQRAHHQNGRFQHPARKQKQPRKVSLAEQN